MAAVAHLAAHPELPRPTLRVGFTPDEEIGEGATLFDVERFGARCAYTLDGSSRRRAAGRDVHRRGGRSSRSPASTSIPASRRASSSTPPGSPARIARRAARRTLTPERTVGPRRLHPRLRGRRRGRARGDAARSCATSTTSCSRAHIALLRRTAEEVVGRRAARPARGRRARRSTRTCAATSSRSRRSSRRAEQAIRAEGIEPRPHADPRRHRRLAPERDGPADAEHLHRRPRVPLAARMGLGAGDGGRRGDVVRLADESGRPLAPTDPAEDRTTAYGRSQGHPFGRRTLRGSARGHPTARCGTHCCMDEEE